MSIDEDSVEAPISPSQNALNKLAPELLQEATGPEKTGLVSVLVYTDDVPAATRVLATLGARRVVTVDGEARSVPVTPRLWGQVGVPTSLYISLPRSALVDLAADPSIVFVDVPRTASLASVDDEVIAEDRAGFLNWKARLQAAAGAKGNPRMGILGTETPGVSPMSWAIAREHKAYDAWQIDLDPGPGTNYAMGGGVNVAVIDTGEDFGHPSLQGRWATAPAGSPWEGWPIMFHPASMEGLFGLGWWTAPEDVARLPLPYWLSVNDGDVWYSNTDYVGNDTDLDGYIRYAHGTPNPFTGDIQYTPRGNPQGYGASCGGADNTRINRNYYVGVDGEPWQIRSASGWYRFGVNRDDTLTGLWCGKVGILVVDSTTPFVYDTVYVDLNFDFNFTNDKPLTKADPIAVADLTGDGVADISGGLLYFIASSSPVSDVVIPSIPSPPPASATLTPRWDFDGDGTPESASVAVDITGWFTFNPPLNARLRSPTMLEYYLPSSTEDIYEEYTTPPGDDTGTRWQLGTGSFGPVNYITFADIPSVATLLRGPGPDFAVSIVLDLEDSSGVLTEGVDYQIDMDAGVITFLRDLTDGDTLFIIYQLATYVLEPVSGTMTFADAFTGASTSAGLPVGWALLADYETGLPIPYSQVLGPQKGYETFIPASGDLVAFHGEFDYGQSHGSFVSSTIAARPFGNLADMDGDGAPDPALATILEVFGTAPDAKIIGIAACCNTPGPLGLFGDILDQETFAAVGYDGVPESGDEAQIASNSWGFTTTLNTGMSFFDRWLIDHWTRYPRLTTLIALGNNGPGYGTSAPGGSSPGVIGVGAGTSQDYRWLFGFDLGDGYWELPDCTLAGSPPDPRLCVPWGFSSPNGPGPYGDHIFFSSRGPTLIGQPKPDIVSIGGYAAEAGPLNVFGNVPADLDGNWAWDLFSGTSQATPVTSGVAALIAQAYRAAHGTFPTNDVLKMLLKSSADDMHRDILQQGAGWTNAERGVRAALDTAAYTGVGRGVTASLDHWRPGGYEGVNRIGFVNFLEPGSSDSVQITLTNRNPSGIATVRVTDAVYQRSVAPFRYSFSLGTGSNQWIILKDDGIYNRDASAKLDPTIDFRPYWNTADFVKVTFTYDAVAYTGSTSLRLDTFDWFDSNGNGLFDQNTGCAGPAQGCRERNRMTVVVNGANANSVWDSIYDPDVRTHDGWALNPRSGATAPIPATIVIEFYEKVDWPWITITGLPPQPFNMAALGTQTMRVTATVPPGTPGGMYEGAVYVMSGGETTTIPIVITVPVTGFPVYLGGNVPSTSLYENSGVVGGARSGWRQIGDTRYIWANFSVAPNVDRSRKVIYNAMLTGPNSDLEMYLFSLTADAAWTDPSVYGPGTMAIPCHVLDKLTGACTKSMLTKETVGATDTLYPNREFMFSDPLPLDDATTRITPVNGLQVFQIKAWSAVAETETLTASIGLMDTTPIGISVATNKLSSQVPIGISANVPLWDGVGAAVTESSVTPIGPMTINLAVNPPGPDFNAWMCGQRAPNAVVLPPVGSVISRSVYAHIVSPVPSDDHDLQVWLDLNGNNVCDNGVDQLLCQSADADADEECTASTTDGTKAILIQIGPYAGGLVTVLTGTDTVLRLGVSPFSLVGPTTDVPANTPINGGIAWVQPGNTPPGTQTGKLFISPGYARFALAQETSITWIYDVTPPTTNRATDLSPPPNSITNDPFASVVANLRDSTGRFDRFSVQLLVDGVDVTPTSKVIAPYSGGYGILPVTVAWEHPAIPFSDGPHSAVVSARDLAGNLLTEVWMWTVDTTGPSLAVLSPAGDVVTNAASWDLVAQTDPGSTVTVLLNGAPVPSAVDPDGVVTATLDISVDAAYDVTVVSADALGNENSVTRRVVRDGTAPVVTAGADASSPTNRLSTRITGTVNEGVTTACVARGVLVLGCTDVGADGSFSLVVPLEEGPNVFTVQTTDAAGNPGSVDLAAIVRDTVAPSIVLDPLPSVVTRIDQDTITVSGTVDPTGLFFVSINGQPVSHDPATGDFSADFQLAVGDNTFVVQATDRAGNSAQTAVSVAFSPVVTREIPNYNSIIASGVAVVLLIVGFVVGYLLSARGGAPPAEPTAPAPPTAEARAEEELPREEPKKTEEEEL